MNPYKIYKNDSGYDIPFILQNPDGSAYDLSNVSSASIKVQKQNSDSLKFTGTMVIDDTASGSCHYAVASGNFDEEGDYYAEIQLSTVGGGTITFGNFVLRCLPDLPR